MPEAASRPPLVLLASHRDWSARSLESILSPSGYAVLRAQSGPQALDQARRARPDAIVLDADLPGHPAADMELCRLLRGDPGIGATTPIMVIINDPATRDQRMQSLRAGAWETFVLPLDAEEFLLKLDAFTRARIEAEGAREGNLLDPATGLYSAGGLLKRAMEMGSEAHRRHRALACVALAPEVNPDPGDDSPGEVASIPTAVHGMVQIFKTYGRVSDAIGRISRTEFAIMAPDTDGSAAGQLVQRLARAAESPRGTIPPMRLRAGCFAVDDFGEAGIAPADLLVGATRALRRRPDE